MSSDYVSTTNSLPEFDKLTSILYYRPIMVEAKGSRSLYPHLAFLENAEFFRQSIHPSVAIANHIIRSYKGQTVTPRLNEASLLAHIITDIVHDNIIGADFMSISNELNELKELEKTEEISTRPNYIALELIYNFLRAVGEVRTPTNELRSLMYPGTYSDADAVYIAHFHFISEEIKNFIIPRTATTIMKITIPNTAISRRAKSA